MQFTLLDRITELHEGESITAVRTLNPDEDYLEDHFPCFPVMPGVLMLEALYQASAWLVRKTEDFKHSLIMMKETRNVKYQGFVEPNEQMVVTAKILKHDDQTTTLKCQGMVGDRPTVSGRLVLERRNFGDQNPEHKPIDDYACSQFRKFFKKLTES